MESEESKNHQSELNSTMFLVNNWALNIIFTPVGYSEDIASVYKPWFIVEFNVEFKLSITLKINVYCQILK